MLSRYTHVRFFAALRTVALQFPLSMGFLRQQYWKGGTPAYSDLPDLGIESMFFTSPAMAGGFFPTSATWEAPFKVFIEFIAILLIYVLVFWPQDMWDLTSLTFPNRPHTPCIRK